MKEFKSMELLKSLEALRVATYDDKTGKALMVGDTCIGRPTIGYGHTGPEAAPGAIISPQRAEELFQMDIAPRVLAVNQMLEGATKEINQNQFDALVIFAYNCGTSALRGSTLLKVIKAGDFEQAPAEFGKWVMSKGVRMEGLIKRRSAEIKLFKTPC